MGPWPHAGLSLWPSAAGIFCAKPAAWPRKPLHVRAARPPRFRREHFDQLAREALSRRTAGNRRGETFLGADFPVHAPGEITPPDPFRELPGDLPVTGQG